MNPFQIQKKNNYSRLIAGVVVLAQLWSASVAVAEDSSDGTENEDAAAAQLAKQSLAGPQRKRAAAKPQTAPSPRAAAKAVQKEPSSPSPAPQPTTQPDQAALQAWVRSRLESDQTQPNAAAKSLSVRPAQRRNAAEPYTFRIEEQNPAAVFLLIDQSSSTAEMSRETGRSIADEIADAGNRTLTDLLNTCSTGELLPDGRAVYKDRFRFWALGYSGHPRLSNLISPGITPTELDQRATYKNTVNEGLVGNWIVPFADGNTPMELALSHIYASAADFMRQYPNGHAVVLNVTDGLPNQLQETLRAANSLMSLRNNNGNLLLFNAVVSAGASQPVEYPSSPDEIWAPGGKRMFHMSSALPALALKAANKQPGARGLVVNILPRQLGRFFKIGTQTLIGNR